MRQYRVWIQQINQTYIDVKAHCKEDAKNRAEVKWRKESYPKITDIVELKKE